MKHVFELMITEETNPVSGEYANQLGGSLLSGARRHSDSVKECSKTGRDVSGTADDASEFLVAADIFQ
jgi:hypothetical protein